MRTLWRVVIPVAVGLVVLVAAVVVPVVHVRGDVANGPIAAGAHPEPWWSPVRPIRAMWTDRHRLVRLTVRWGRECPPVLLGETSLAPARIEVHLRLGRGAACRAHRVTTAFTLRPARVAEPGQGVMLLVDGARFDLPRYTR